MAIMPPSPVFWIIDDGPLDMMARCIPPHVYSAWNQDFLAVVEATEASAQQNPRRSQLLQQACFEILPVIVGDVTDQILRQHLHRPFNATNLAEHQAIAWSLAHPDRPSVLVLADRRASLLALAELTRCHVAHPFELWDTLLYHQMIDTTTRDALDFAMCKHDQSHLPWRRSQ
jgi:hypothetical protein